MATNRSQKDACDLLDADHRAVKKMFKEYEELTGSRARGAAQKKMDLARQICHELTVHAQIEEEIFYPALRAVADEELEELLNEAQVEHRSVKDLVAQIEDMLQGAGDEGMFEARVKVLAEYVKHHVREEEREIFPLVRDTDIDLKALGARLARRKEELSRQLQAH